MAVDCYECGAYGDDWYIDDNGEPVCACAECMMNEYGELGFDGD